MAPPSAPTITPGPAADQPPPPTRSELREASRELLKRGAATKADVWRVDSHGAALVVKDFADKPWWARWIGRVQLGREWRAYRRLGPQPYLPRLVGRIDAHALALEWVGGEELARSPLRHESGTELLERLRDIVARMHGAGLAHLDLRGRENVLVDAGGALYVIDLASAVWLRPGGLAHRLLFRWLAVADRAALLKWKRLLDAGPYTDEEHAFLERFDAWRALWPFNRKRRGRARGGR